MRSRDIKYIIFIVIIALLSVHQCSKSKTQTIEQTNFVEFLQDSIAIFKNKKGQNVSEKLALQMENKNLKILNDQKNKETQRWRDRYQRLDASIDIKTEIHIDTIKFKYIDSIPLYFNKDFEIKDRNYSLMGISNNKGIFIDSISMNADINIVVGQKKSGYKINLTSSNPYLHFNDVDAFIRKDPLKRFHIGPYVGVGLGPELQFQPSFGVGLTYSIYSF